MCERQICSWTKTAAAFNKSVSRRSRNDPEQSILLINGCSVTFQQRSVGCMQRILIGFWCRSNETARRMRACNCGRCCHRQVFMANFELFASMLDEKRVPQSVLKETVSAVPRFTCSEPCPLFVFKPITLECTMTALYSLNVIARVSLRGCAAAAWKGQHSIHAYAVCAEVRTMWQHATCRQPPPSVLSLERMPLPLTSLITDVPQHTTLCRLLASQTPTHRPQRCYAHNATSPSQLQQPMLELLPINTTIAVNFA